MKVVRYVAAAATALMALMNLPIAFDDGGAGLAAPVAWLISLLGVIGLVVAVALCTRATWAPAAAFAVGGLNLIGAIWAVATGSPGGFIGLTVSLAGVALAAAVLLRGRTAARAHA
jgi:hypothetical protein